MLAMANVRTNIDEKMRIYHNDPKNETNLITKENYITITAEFSNVFKLPTLHIT